MKRVIEPELMSDKEQAIAYANANFEEPHNHFLELLRYSIEKKIKTIEIIPGKGSGQLKKKVLRFLNQAHIKKRYHRID